MTMHYFQVMVERKCTVGMCVTVLAHTTEHAEAVIKAKLVHCKGDPDALPAVLGTEWRVVEDGEADGEVEVVYVEPVSVEDEPFIADVIYPA